MSRFPSSPFMRALAAGIQANVPVLIEGEPGQGKTATIENAARAWGMHPETIIGSTREATDFLGVMVEDKGAVSYSTFEWVKKLNSARKGLLFLDEFNTSSPATMKGMLRVVQERFVGDTRLKDSVRIVAAANPPETAVDGYDLPAPMANRMMHLKWVFDVDNWMENVATGFAAATYPALTSILTADPVARKAAVAGAVAAFLQRRPTLLAPSLPTDSLGRIDPVKAGKAWASPRSWTNTIEVLSQLEADDIEAAKLVMDGLVGQDISTQYFAWLATADLHDPSEVLKDPNIVAWTKERADRLFALVQGVTALGLSKPELWRDASLVLTACAVSGRPDVAAPGAQMLMNNIPHGKAMPKAFQSAFLDLFERTFNTVSAA